MDLDAVLDFIFCPEEKRDVDVNIEETYVNDVNDKDKIILASKTRTENKTSNHEQHETVRYDIFRRLLDTLDNIPWDEEEGTPTITCLTEEISVNTLLQYGFIKMVKKER